jgi:hypothetical protein
MYLWMGAITPQRGRPCPKEVWDRVRYTMYRPPGFKLVHQGYVVISSDLARIWRWRWRGNVTTAGRGGHQTIETFGGHLYQDLDYERS